MAFTDAALSTILQKWELLTDGIPFYALSVPLLCAFFRSRDILTARKSRGNTGHHATPKRTNSIDHRSKASAFPWPGFQLVLSLWSHPREWIGGHTCKHFPLLIPFLVSPCYLSWSATGCKTLFILRTLFTGLWMKHVHSRGWQGAIGA